MFCSVFDFAFDWIDTILRDSINLASNIIAFVFTRYTKHVTFLKEYFLSENPHDSIDLGFKTLSYCQLRVKRNWYINEFIGWNKERGFKCSSADKKKHFLFNIREYEKNEKNKCSIDTDAMTIGSVCSTSNSS